MLYAVAIAFTVSWLLSGLLSRSRGRWQILDVPNARSLHNSPTPRTGGIAILLGAAAGLLVAGKVQAALSGSAPLIVSVAILAAISLADDRYNLGAGVRLLIQVCTIGWLLLITLESEIDLVTALLALLFLAWMVNLYNFMDGMDGFAGGMSVIGFSTFAILGWQAGQMEITLGSATVAAACAGFLLLNFPPARLFMGDVGSTVLGLLAGIAILQSHRDGLLPAWLGILVFSPFIVDATVTLAIRILHREQFWKPHRSHCYQRLALAGWGHRRTVLAEYILMLACCGSAAGATTLPPAGQMIVIAMWLLIYAALIGLIHRSTSQSSVVTKDGTDRYV